MKRRTLTVRPSFKAFLDRAAKEAEAGATISFGNQEDALAFLRRAKVAPTSEE